MKRRTNPSRSPQSPETHLIAWVRSSIGPMQVKRDLVQHVRTCRGEGPIRMLAVGSALTRAARPIAAYSFMGQLFEFFLNDSQAKLLNLGPGNCSILHTKDGPEDPVFRAGPPLIELKHIEIERPDALEAASPIRGRCRFRFARGAESWLRGLVEFQRSPEVMAGPKSAFTPFSLGMQATVQEDDESGGVVHSRGFFYPDLRFSADQVNSEHQLEFEFPAISRDGMGSPLKRPQLVAGFVYFCRSATEREEEMDYDESVERRENRRARVNTVPISNPIAILFTLT